MQPRPEMRTVRARDRAAFNALFALQHVMTTSPAVQRRRAATQDRIIRRLRRDGPGRTVPVERRDHLSPKEFQRRYLRWGEPVVITGGAKNWPAISKWTFDNLRSNYGEEMIKLVQREGLTNDDVPFEKEYSEEIRFGEFLDLVLSGGSKYMRFSPLLEQFPELRRDLDAPFLKELTNTHWGQGFQLFIGAQGTVTPFHNAMSPFFYTMVAGSKKWRLVPNRYLAVMDPPVDHFQYNHSDVAVDLSNVDECPGLDSIDHLEVDLEAGDLLFVPSWMWHSVLNTTPSIGIRCGFVYLPGAVQQAVTLAALRVAIGDPNIFRWLYYTYIRSDLYEREHLLLTSKLFPPKLASGDVGDLPRWGDEDPRPEDRGRSASGSMH